jgi:hypothetical protein
MERVETMKKLQTALALGSLLAGAAGATITPTVASAKTVKTYVACNQYGACWRVKQVYAYGEKVPIRYYDSAWYEAHRTDPKITWLADPATDRGYYLEDRTWHEDPGARAVKGGALGAGLGAAIGCLGTLPIGCAPGAAVGAAVGGGTGAVTGAATTPHD